jgi:isoleucyl-tRNA synthetase
LAQWYDGLAPLSDSVFDNAFWLQVLDVKNAVNKALEQQRKAGTVGKSLEAEVTLYCEPKLLASLSVLGDELRFVLLTSTASLAAFDTANSALVTELDGLQLSIQASAHAKCDRCWHHREDVGSVAAHPELCGRCVSNVDGDGEKRLFA